MNRSQFWELMDSTRPKNGDLEEHLQRLENTLAKIDAKDLLDFEKIIVELGH